MTPKTSPLGTSRPFYGWTALAGAAIEQLTGAGAFLYSFGIFLPVMCAEFGWNRAALSLGMSLGMLFFGLPGPLIGITVAKYGPRIHIILGNSIVALGLVGMAFVRESWQVYLLYCIMGAGSGAAHFIAGNVIANNWFVKKRSLAMGIVASALGLGGFIFPPITTVLISTFGYQISWLALAGIVFVGGTLLSGIILVRNKPEDMGQFPDGINPAPSLETGTNDLLSETREETATWTTGQAMRNPTTWLITAFLAANVFAVGVMIAHQVAYVEDLRYSALIAAMTVSVFSALNIVGMLGFGFLALRYNIRYLTCAGFASTFLAIVILLTTKNLGLIYLYAILFGIGTGALATAETTIISAYYGRANFAKILGTIVPFLMIVEAAGPIIAGSIYDATGKYTITFIIIAAFILVGLLLAFLTRPPKLSPVANHRTSGDD